MFARSATFLVAVCMLVAGTADAQASKHQVWTVRPGDVLSVLAEEFGVSVAQIKERNELTSDLIRVGQKLVIEAANQPRPEPTAESFLDAPAPPPVDKIDIETIGDISIMLEEVDVDGEQELIATVSPVAVSALSPEPEPVEAPAPIPPTDKPAIYYKVVRGDTLSEIAARHHTSLSSILASNPDLNPDRIRPGDAIRIGEPKPRIEYTIERGDTLSTIAERFAVHEKDLKKWNDALTARRLKVGQTVAMYTDISPPQSMSVGPTNNGKLIAAVRLPPHPLYAIRTEERAWGTAETIRWIVDAFNAVERKFNTKKRVRVHDISDADGGRLRDHKSHQSGRDVDISYYRNDCDGKPCAFEKTSRRQLDTPMQWALLKHWLDNDQLEVVFIDYQLQKPLYKHAKRRGASDAQLRRWFQYPNGKDHPSGIIRHYKKHADHMHVRFVCPVTDSECE